MPFLLQVLGACATVPAGPAPDLRATDGSPASLDFASHEATVLVFWSTTCPCVARYRARVEALASSWSAQDVQVVAVSSNVDEDLAALRAAPPPVPLLIDEGGRLALELGARSTPTVVVLDRAGAVRYRGWLDNERLPGDPRREAWLEQALVDLVSGRGLTRDASPVWGCRITRSLGDAPRCQPVAREPGGLAPVHGPGQPPTGAHDADHARGPSADLHVH